MYKNKGNENYLLLIIKKYNAQNTVCLHNINGCIM